MTHQPILAWCNEQREKLGLKPAKKLARGRAGWAEECPVARTIRGRSRHRVAVDSNLVDLTPAGAPPCTVIPSDPVADFIVDFDRGCYPELERRP